MSGKETSASVSKGGHTQGTAQDESELEQKEAGVQQEDTVLAQGATPGGPAYDVSLCSGRATILIRFSGACFACCRFFLSQRCVLSASAVEHSATYANQNVHAHGADRRNVHGHIPSTSQPGTRPSSMQQIERVLHIVAAGASQEQVAEELANAVPLEQATLEMGRPVDAEKEAEPYKAAEAAGTLAPQGGPVKMEQG